MEEKTFFEQNNVKVSNARFIVDGQTFAMNGVTSVKAVVVPPSRMGPIIGLLIGLAILIGAGGMGKLLGLVVAGAAGYILYSQKATHIVVLNSASGEQNALSNTDASFITGVVTALNDALIHRG